MQAAAVSGNLTVVVRDGFTFKGKLWAAVSGNLTVVVRMSCHLKKSEITEN